MRYCRPIPTVHRKKDKPEVPVDVRIKELEQDIGISRDQFAHIDRARDRQLRELQVSEQRNITFFNIFCIEGSRWESKHSYTLW